MNSFSHAILNWTRNFEWYKSNIKKYFFQLDKKGSSTLSPLLDSLEYIRPAGKSAVSPYDGFQVIKRRNMCEPCDFFASAIKTSTPALLLDESDQQSQLFLLRRISHHAGLQSGRLNDKNIIWLMKQPAIRTNDVKQVYWRWCNGLWWMTSCRLDFIRYQLYIDDICNR